MSYADSLGNALSGARTDTDKVNIQLALSASFKATDVTKEFYYANSALERSTTLDYNLGKMKAEVLVGDCYFRVNGYQEAITHFKNAIDEANKTNKAATAADCYRMLALCYRGLNDHEQMLRYQQTAKELATKIDDPPTYCRMMRTYGLFLSEAGFYRRAVDQELQTIAYARSHFNDSQQQAVVSELMNIAAGAYIKLNRPDSAIAFLRQAIALADSSKFYYSAAYINSTFCDVFAETKEYDSAIVYGLRAIKMGEMQKNLDLQQYYSRMLSSIYEQKQDPLRALNWHKKHDSLHALINNTQMKVDLALQVSKINMQQESRQNDLEKRSINTIRRNQQAVLIAAAIALAALITITILVYKNLRQKQKANDTITSQAASLVKQNIIIDNALKEKEVLLKETHHRIKNNLQLISSLLELQAANLRDEQARMAILAAQNRVLSIASVHTDLSPGDEFERIELHDFTDGLFNRLHNALGNKSVKFQGDIPVTFLPLNKVVLIGLILNELITNSFKYAYAETHVLIIHIRLAKNDDNLTLTYHDNGPGLPEGRFDNATGSLGIYLVKRLAKQLKGNITYQYDRGSIFTINFRDAAS